GPSRSPTRSARRCCPTCPRWPRPACRAPRAWPGMASWRRPARPPRSWTACTTKSPMRWPAPTCRRSSPAWASWRPRTAAPRSASACATSSSASRRCSSRSTWSWIDAAMPRTVLITGASGLVGTAAVDSFLNAGWDVVAVSRRRPEVFSERPFTHLPVDLQDAAACQAAFGRLPQVSHVVYAAVYEKPTLIAGWRDPEQMATNLAMIKNVIEPLARTAHLRHVTLLQGTKAYGVHLHPIRIPAREREPRDDHPNSYWFQEDYIRKQAGQHGFG